MTAADERKHLVAELVDAYPRERIETRNIEVYLSKLADVPPHLLADVIHDLICTGDRFPTIAQIKFACAERVTQLPTETEALTEIERRLRWRRQDEETRGVAPAVTPEVAEALAHVGGYTAFREADEPTIIRGQFARYYREIRATRVRRSQVGSTVAQALESPSHALEP